MANYQMIRRLKSIIQVVRNYPEISKKELMQRLENDYDIPITARTLERDFKALDVDFGIEIGYDRQEKGYVINKEDDLQVLTFLQLAGRIYLGDLLRKGLKDFQDLQETIVLEDNSNFEGVQAIQPLLLAIKNKCTVRFLHENYQKGTKTNYHIVPFQLKEYQGRWYVVGVPKDEQHIKTFGLARISRLETMGAAPILSEKFKVQLKKFDRIIGLNYDAAKNAEYIELAVNKQQYKYLKSLPLHRSQGYEGKLPDGRVKLSLYLIPNYELKMQLLKLGDQIEVLRPKKLRNELKKILMQTIKLYHHE